MTAFLKGAVCIIGALFLVLGSAGMFTPQDFASGVSLSFIDDDGAGTVRAMIGAHYLAMGAVCIYAVIRENTVLLLPIAAIEAMMVVGRGMAALNGEFSAATMIPTGIEIAAAIILFVSASRLARPE